MSNHDAAPKLCVKYSIYKAIYTLWTCLPLIDTHNYVRHSKKNEYYNTLFCYRTIRKWVFQNEPQTSTNSNQILFHYYTFNIMVIYTFHVVCKQNLKDVMYFYYLTYIILFIHNIHNIIILVQMIKSILFLRLEKLYIQ